MKFYFSLGILFIFFQSEAQNWAISSSIWRYSFTQISGRGFIEIKVVKDTIIDGINCKQLNKKKFQENAFTGNTQAFNIGSEYTYEENGIVYIRYNNVFDTLYNFNASVGSSWNVPGNSPVSGVCNDISKVKVMAVDNVTINSISLKRLIVDYEYKATFKIRDTIIESIGTLAQYLLPWDNCLSTFDGNEGGELRCYEDATLGEYKHNFYSDCTVLISVEEDLKKVATIYPNPFTDILKIETTRPIDKFQVSIFDMYGKLVNSSMNTIVINTNTLPQGLYVIAIKENNKLLGRKRIIKQ